MNQTTRDMPKQQPFVLVVALGAALVSNAARAGECPADKVGVDATKPVTTPAKGVTDTVLAAIDLAQEPVNIADRKLRLRKLIVQPGGVVPWHSHGDRPAIIYIIDGTITEYASNCEADRPQGGRSRARDERHIALVEKLRPFGRDPAVRRRAAR
jgi:hypothetical protein